MSRLRCTYCGQEPGTTTPCWKCRRVPSDDELELPNEIEIRPDSVIVLTETAAKMRAMAPQTRALLDRIARRIPYQRDPVDDD